MSTGLYSGVSGLALGVGLYKGVPGLWGGASGLITGDGASLSLNFLTSNTLDPRVTFTRSTTATFVGSNGLIQTAAINAPRFDYNPVTLAPNGLLIEEQRVNLLLYSDQFQQATWSKGSGSITANTILSPDGTTNADAFIENTVASQFHFVAQSIAKAASNIQYAASFYVKNKGRQVGISFNSGSAGVAGRVDPATGTITAALGVFGTGWTAGTLTITNAGNGWYRVVVTATSDTLTTAQLQLSLINGANNVYTGDGVSGAFFWGAQLEAGAFVTSYIPTVASTVTRTADVALMTGTNFSSWYNASEGTLVTSALPIVSSVSKYSWSFNDGTGTELIAQYFLNVNAGGFVVDNGSAQVQIEAGTFSGVCKTAFAYKINDFALSLNGGTVATDTVGTIPTTTQAQIGNRPDGSRTMNGHIRTLTYYPSRLTNAQLQALTA